MLQVRKSIERGRANHGWLKTQHTFSFANYFDPNFMGFRSLRVINEDYIAGGRGFGKHPHNDMEIITYLVSGSLQHQDTMGNTAIIKPGEVQKLSAGTGMMHSEMNNQPFTETHLFQIWIQPNRTGDAPSYGQRSFAKELAERRLVLTISGDGRDGSIQIQQDADMYIARLEAGDEREFKLRKKRGAWIQVVKGSFDINGSRLSAGDGLAVEEEGVLNFKALENGEFILFDLA